jgi:uncharacterized membrane protein YvbJ
MPYCHVCGTKLLDDAAFCFNCGAKVAGTSGTSGTGATSNPSDEMREAFTRMSIEMEKAFNRASKEVQEAFETARNNIQKNANKNLIVCPNCGEKNALSAEFCFNCGKKLSEPSTGQTQGNQPTGS